MKRLVIHGLLLTLILVTNGCRGEKTEDGGGENNDGMKTDHSSPESIATSFKSAMSAKNWSKGVACMDDDSQRAFVTMIGVSASATAGLDMDKSKRQSLDELFLKHDLKKGKKDLDKVKDLGALAADLVNWLEENASPDTAVEGPSSMADHIGRTEFRDFQTDGDSATAQFVASDKTEKTAYFKKVDGKWYLDLATMMKKKKIRRSSVPEK